MKEFPEMDASVAPDKTWKLAVRIYVDCGPSVSPSRIGETGNDFRGTQSNGEHLQFTSVTYKIDAHSLVVERPITLKVREVGRNANWPPGR